MKQLIQSVFFILVAGFNTTAQTTSKDLPSKIKHAEPICVDLIKDLGARKGEHEVNAGFVMRYNDHYTATEGFVEYEFAPLNRLGIEVEVPFRLSTVGRDGTAGDELPRKKVEGIKPAFQYTFLVSEKAQLSMAAGSIFELHLHSFATMRKDHNIWKGYTLSPFMVAAKRWGKHFQTLLYTGPEFYKPYAGKVYEISYLANFSIHYMLAQSHFVGLEINQEFLNGETVTVFNPQTKIKLSSNLSLGLATNIPLSRSNAGTGFLARIIYAP